jgi:O-antigen ligase
VLAAAIPALFLHVRYQPGVAVGLGSTTVSAYLSDVAVLAVVALAAAEARRQGFAALAPGRPLWIVGALFLFWMAAAVIYGRLHASAYAWQTHGVTAAKFAEYALLAPALPLLLRRTRDLLLPVWSLALWSSAATVVGIAQFFGADIFIVGTFGHRQASFLSEADFAALSAAALLVGLVALAAPVARMGRVPATIATASGALGMIVAGAVASLLGLATALGILAVVLFVRRRLLIRRLVVAGAVSLIVAGGIVAIRGSDLGAFARFLGASPRAAKVQTKVQTYAHRTLLAWIGFEIWKDNPLLGVGWEGSSEPVNFEPYLPAAHQRFPDEAPLAFPSAAPDRRYGVQNSWIQALADLGVIGLMLWVGTFAAAASVAVKRLDAVTALYGLLATGLLVWLWTAQGFVAGIPLDALTFLAFGAAATRLVDE